MQPDQFKVTEYSYLDALREYCRDVMKNPALTALKARVLEGDFCTSDLTSTLQWHARQFSDVRLNGAMPGPSSIHFKILAGKPSVCDDVYHRSRMYLNHHGGYAYLGIPSTMLMLYRPLLRVFGEMLAGNMDEETAEAIAILHTLGFDDDCIESFDPRPVKSRCGPLYLRPTVDDNIEPTAWADCPAICQLAGSPLQIGWHNFNEVELTEGIGFGNSEYICATPAVAAWRLREAARLAHGRYARLPPALESQLPAQALFTLFPHLPEKSGNAGQIAFTQNANAGVRDRQQVMKPGRFFRMALPEVSDQYVKELTAMFESIGQLTFHMSHDQEDFARVYIHGPSSCMGYDEGKFGHLRVNGDFFHPVRVYAHPDNNLRIVWMESEGKIAARAVVNLRNKTYPTIYACDWLHNAHSKFTEYLSEKGFYQDGEGLDGEKILLVSPDRNSEAIICPYIDSGNRGVEICDDYMVIGGKYEANHATGCLESYDIDSACCDYCDETTDEDDLTTVESGDRVCDYCLGQHFVYAYAPSDGCCMYVPDDSSDLYGTSHIPSSRVAYANYVVIDNNRFVALDTEYYGSEAALSEDAIYYAVDSTYILYEDIDRLGFFLLDGDLERVEDYCLVDGEPVEISSVDISALEEVDNHSDEYSMLTAYITPAQEEAA